MTAESRYEVVIVGAGQAGVSLSHYLAKRGIDHVVLERDAPFSSWRNRWDGFTTNTPNWMNTLPWLADRFPSNDPKAFATRGEIVAYLDECLALVDPPLRLGVTVEGVSADGEEWRVATSEGDYLCNSVVLCNGAMSQPSLPSVAADLPDWVPQRHSSTYRRPDQVTTGSVLVVGSASSGVQICRLLCESGRFEQVHLAASNVLVLPRRILRIQTHRFLHTLGFFDVRVRSLLGRIMYSGLETRGDPIMRPAPKDLRESYGVHLYEKLVAVEGGRLVFADGKSLDPHDLTVIWCTGFKGAHDLIESADAAKIFTSSGGPRHRRGVVDTAPGLFFVGLRYQHTVASHDIYGVAKDAEYVANRIAQRLSDRTRTKASGSI